MPTIDQYLRKAQQQLEKGGIETARLDSLILLEDVLIRDRSWLLASPSDILNPAQVAKLDYLLKRRVRHEPLAYIRGKSEFYGRNFVINKSVLQPRPESEDMIELLKEIYSNPTIDAGIIQSPKSVMLADVGCGSGALGITAYLELPDAEVDLIDNSTSALKVAKMNVDIFTLSIKLIRADLLQGNQFIYDALLCNLPYVPDGYIINEAAKYEPSSAIFGGSDGLKHYKRLFKQISKLKHKPLYILCEAFPSQHERLANLASKAGYKLRKHRGYIQLFENR